MALSTNSAPELTSEQVRSILTQPLEERSIFLSSGPTIIDTPGPLRIPFAPGAGDPDALEWTGENELIPEVDPTFSEMSLLPSTMKSIKVITRYSNELARQSNVSLDTTLRSRLVSDVATKVDTQLFSDQGDGITTPKGMFAWDDTQDVAVDGAISLDAILDAQAVALGSNVNQSNLRLFLRPGDYMALRGAKDGDERYMLQPDATRGAVSSVLGLPVSVTSRIPAGRAALVDMSQVVVARDVMSSVKLLTERYADYDQQAIRVVTRYDAAPVQPDAVVTFSGITA